MERSVQPKPTSVHEADTRGDINFTIRCEIEDDVLSQEEDFMRLVRQGLFKDAHNLFKTSLDVHRDAFEVFADLTECLYDQGLIDQIPAVVAHQNSMELTSDEKDYIKLLTALLQADPKPDDSLQIAREWYDSFQGDMMSAKDVEILTTEMYFAIVITCMKHCHLKLDEQYLRSPFSKSGARENIAKYCQDLYDDGRLWEAARIFEHLAAVLPDNEVQDLFGRLTGGPRLEQDAVSTLVDLSLVNSLLKPRPIQGKLANPLDARLMKQRKIMVEEVESRALARCGECEITDHCRQRIENEALNCLAEIGNSQSTGTSFPEIAILTGLKNKAWSNTDIRLVESLHTYEAKAAQWAGRTQNDMQENEADSPRIEHTGKSLPTLEAYNNWSQSVSFTPDGKRLASASWDKIVRLWNTQTGMLRQTFEGHNDRVQSVAFSPDGKRLASASWDKTVRIWDIQTGISLQILEGHNDRVQSVAFSPDGKRLASASCDKTVRIWDTQTGVSLQILKGHSSQVWSVVFSPNGQQLASASSDNTVRFWDVQTGALLQTLEGHNDRVQSVVFSPNGQQVASVSWDKTVQLLGTQAGTSLGSLIGLSMLGVLTFPFVAPIVLAGGAAFGFRDAWTRKLPLIFRGHSDRVQSVAFSPDGKRLASASWDKTVRIWDTQTGVSLQILKGHSSQVWSVVFSPNGQQLASASSDKTVRLWDTQTGVSLQTLKGHSSQVWSVVFSPSGQQLASASSDKTVRLWDPQTGASLQILKGHSYQA